MLDPTPDLLASSGQRSDRSARSAKRHAKPTEGPPGGQVTSGWRILRAVAEEYDALQGYRIAAGNRARYAEVTELNDLSARTEGIEHSLGILLTRTYRQVVPAEIRAWQRAQLGIGELQLARLLGHLGHPRIATPHHWEGTGSDRELVDDEPYERTVGQLWAYCGRTGERRAAKGMSAEEAAQLGKPLLKMLTHLIAEAMIKAGVRQTSKPNDADDYDLDARTAISPWGRLYLDQRKINAERLDWSRGHQHNAARHRVAKEMLKQLWLVSA
jgi:hypothetical protein